MAKTIFDITREDLNPKEFEALQEKARDFLWVPEKEEVKETQEQVVLEVEEKLEEWDFWKPDTKQQEILDKMPEKLREKLKWKLFFREKKTEIIIENWQKLVFDKIQQFTESSDWEIAMERAKSIWQRLLTKWEFEWLFDLFKIWDNYYRDELKKILNIIGDTYWSSIACTFDSDNAWYGNFYDGFVDYYYKINPSHYTICVHD